MNTIYEKYVRCWKNNLCWGYGGSRLSDLPTMRNNQDLKWNKLLLSFLYLQSHDICVLGKKVRVLLLPSLCHLPNTLMANVDAICSCLLCCELGKITTHCRWLVDAEPEWTPIILTAVSLCLYLPVFLPPHLSLYLFIPLSICLYTDLHTCLPVIQYAFLFACYSVPWYYFLYRLPSIYPPLTCIFTLSTQFPSSQRSKLSTPTNQSGEGMIFDTSDTCRKNGLVEPSHQTDSRVDVKVRVLRGSFASTIKYQERIKLNWKREKWTWRLRCWEEDNSTVKSLQMLILEPINGIYLVKRVKYKQQKNGKLLTGVTNEH